MEHNVAKVETAEKTYPIGESLLIALGQYFAERPWREANQFIMALDAVHKAPVTPTPTDLEIPKD